MSDFGFASTATDLSAIRQTLSDFEVEAPETEMNRRLPRVGEVVNELYHVESVRGLKRYQVRHRLLEESFELRIHNWVSSRGKQLDEIQQASRTASLVGNSNAAVTVDVGVCRQFGVYSVVEVVDGTSLSELLRNHGQFTVDEVMRFALEIGAALGSLHEVGVVHGLVDLDDLVLSEESNWKLVGAGLPASPDCVWQLRAPEVDDVEGVSALSDQWVFAAILYRMLVGHAPSTSENRAPGRRRSDVPEQLDKAIMRGLDGEPSARWSAMEGILETLQRGFHVWRQPSMVPMDAREVSRLLKMHPDIAVGSFDRERTRQSVVVRVGSLQNAKPNLAVSFRNVARLRREYRHNLAHGGMFVPTTQPPNCGSEVTVTIELGALDRHVELDGVVTNVTEGSGTNPPGAGIVFDAASVERLLGFLRDVGVVRGLRASDMVVRTADFSDVDGLSAEELFLYSLVITAPTVADLRSECSSLPCDFEETLRALVERGALAMERSNPSTARFPFRPSRPATGAKDKFGAPLRLQGDDLEFLLEQVDFHEERRALLAASALIERGLAHLPDEARLHHRRARLLARGFNDLIAAKACARRALELDPKRREYQETLTWIDGVVEREAIRLLYHRVFPVTNVHFMGWDSRRNCAWILTRSRLQPDRVRLLGIDVVRDTIVHSETLEDCRDLHFVWDARVHAGENPVVWRGSSRPAAISADGATWAFERDPAGERRGLYVGRVDQDDWQLVGAADQSILHTQFAPNSTDLMWSVEEADGATGIWLRCANESAQRVFRSEGLARAAWNGRGDGLIVIDAATGRVWSVDLAGKRTAHGEVAPGFTNMIVDGSNETAALLYDAHGTEALWMDLESGKILQRAKFDELVLEASLRSDGNLVGRNREGVVMADLSLGVTRSIPGIRLEASCLRLSSWTDGDAFVAMRTRPNALELVAFKVDLLLA